jgi:hypothetical protein
MRILDLAKLAGKASDIVFNDMELPFRRHHKLINAKLTMQAQHRN